MHSNDRQKKKNAVGEWRRVETRKDMNILDSHVQLLV